MLSILDIVARVFFFAQLTEAAVCKLTCKTQVEKWRLPANSHGHLWARGAPSQLYQSRLSHPMRSDVVLQICAERQQESGVEDVSVRVLVRAVSAEPQTLRLRN